jgi:hypothetical protein
MLLFAKKYLKKTTSVLEHCRDGKKTVDSPF